MTLIPRSPRSPVDIGSGGISPVAPSPHTVGMNAVSLIEQAIGRCASQAERKALARELLSTSLAAVAFIEGRQAASEVAYRAADLLAVEKK